MFWLQRPVGPQHAPKTLPMHVWPTARPHRPLTEGVIVFPGDGAAESERLAFPMQKKCDGAGGRGQL